MFTNILHGVRGNVYSFLITHFFCNYILFFRWQSAWWKRERKGEYFPAFNKDSQGLVEYLKARNLLPPLTKQSVNPIWKSVLDSIRFLTNHLEATLLLWSIFTAGCAIITTTTKNK